MVPANDGCEATGFTVSIEARTGVTTGISAADRARTIQVAIDPDSGPEDLVRPGHIFPLRARPNGVLERRGQTEAAIDLTRLAGLTPGGVLCEVMNPDGTMARGVQLQALCRRHDLPMVTVEEIAAHLNADRPPRSPPSSARSLLRLPARPPPLAISSLAAFTSSPRLTPRQAVSLPSASL